MSISITWSLGCTCTLFQCFSSCIAWGWGEIAHRDRPLWALGERGLLYTALFALNLNVPSSHIQMKSLDRSGNMLQKLPSDLQPNSQKLRRRGQSTCSVYTWTDGLKGLQMTKAYVNCGKHYLWEEAAMEVHSSPRFLADVRSSPAEKRGNPFFLLSN